MKTVTTYVARRAGDHVDLPPLRIEFSERVPDCETLEDSRQLYRAAASRLVDALDQSAPGGLVDALLAELCRRRASLLQVPHGITDKP